VLGAPGPTEIGTLPKKKAALHVHTLFMNVFMNGS